MGRLHSFMLACSRAPGTGCPWKWSCGYTKSRADRHVSLLYASGRGFTIRDLDRGVRAWFVAVSVYERGDSVEVQPLTAAEFDAFLDWPQR